MEDRSIALEDLGKYIEDDKHSGSGFYGIFDGHQGHEAAEFLRTYSPFILKELDGTDLVNDLKTTIEELDSAFIAKCQLDGISGGSTALIAIVRDNALYYGWLGDCECHLITKSGELIKLVKPHKLSDPEVIDCKFFWQLF